MTKNILLNVVTKGRLLALPTNIRLGCKCLLWTNALAYFASVSMTKKQGFLRWPKDAILAQQRMLLHCVNKAVNTGNNSFY
jgi:hypothetical protein